MSELCDPTDAELRALCASATAPSHLESLIPLANYRDIVALRRKLHEFPELANREHGTATTLREELTAIDGVELLGFAAGGTGVLALIEGATTEGRTILFRADMDGLPIAEKADARATALADPTQAPCCALCSSHSSSRRRQRRRPPLVRSPRSRASTASLTRAGTTGTWRC